MPRSPRNYLKTSFFHVITQGISRSYIFDKPEDIKYYIKTMYESMEKHPLKIISYCIMNNHAHILIKTECVNELRKQMQRINTKYGMYYNKKYNRVGYVFRDRYKAEGIYNEEHLYNCIKYIYDNPVKAGICLKPQDYPYSNFKKTIEIKCKNKYVFLDAEIDRDDKQIISEYLKQNNISLLDIKNKKDVLNKSVKVLKDDYKVSLRTIAEELNMGREVIRKLYKE